MAQIVLSLKQRAFRRVVSGVGRIVPRSLRFQYARLVATLFRRIMAPRLRPAGVRLGSDATLALGYVMRLLTDRGSDFDIPTRVRGLESIPNGAALYVTGHLTLSAVAVRFLSERGVPVIFVRLSDEEHLLIGTRSAVRVLMAGDKHVLVRMRNALRSGASVAAMLDDVAAGELFIRAQAIEVAVRSGIPIVFFGAKAGDDGVIEVVFERPRASDTEAIARELLDFIKHF